MGWRCRVRGWGMVFDTAFPVPFGDSCRCSVLHRGRFAPGGVFCPPESRFLFPGPVSEKIAGIAHGPGKAVRTHQFVEVSGVILNDQTGLHTGREFRHGPRNRQKDIVPGAILCFRNLPGFFLFGLAPHPLIIGGRHHDQFLPVFPKLCPKGPHGAEGMKEFERPFQHLNEFTTGTFTGQNFTRFRIYLTTSTDNLLGEFLEFVIGQKIKFTRLEDVLHNLLGIFDLAVMDKALGEKITGELDKLYPFFLAQKTSAPKQGMAMHIEHGRIFGTVNGVLDIVEKDLDTEFLEQPMRREFGHAAGMKLVVFPVLVEPAPPATDNQHAELAFPRGRVHQIPNMFQHVVDVPALLSWDKIAVPVIGRLFNLAADQADNRHATPCGTTLKAAPLHPLNNGV